MQTYSALEMWIYEDVEIKGFKLKFMQFKMHLSKFTKAIWMTAIYKFKKIQT